MRDDEILDDDFDIEDDFDSDFDMDDDLPASEDSAPLSPTNDSAQKKSFLQKFFLPIAAFLVVLFGLIFAAGQGFFSGQQQQETVADNTMANSEVAPTPDVTPPQENVQQNADIVDIPETAPTDLTPLPGEASTESLELVDLEAELVENTALEETLALVDQESTTLESDVLPFASNLPEELTVVAEPEILEIKDTAVETPTELPLESNTNIAESEIVEDIPEIVSPTQEETDLLKAEIDTLKNEKINSFRVSYLSLPRVMIKVH